MTFTLKMNWKCIAIVVAITSISFVSSSWPALIQNTVRVAANAGTNVARGVGSTVSNGLRITAQNTGRQTTRIIGATRNAGQNVKNFGKSVKKSVQKKFGKKEYNRLDRSQSTQSLNQQTNSATNLRRTQSAPAVSKISSAICLQRNS